MSLRDQADCFRVHQCTFRFSTNNADARQVIAGLYRQFHEPGSTEADVQARLDEHPGAFRWQVAERAGEASDLASALLSLEAALCEAVIRLQKRPIALHSAVLFSARAVVLLSGPSGAGKSTTALALAHRGFDVGTDDVALVDPDDLSVCPIPRCFHLDDRSLALLEADGLRLPPSRFGSSFLTPRDFGMRAVLQRRASVLISIQATRLAQPQLMPVSQAEMAGRLYQETGQSSHGEREIIGALARLAAGASCYTLIPGPLASTADMIAELAAREIRGLQASETPVMSVL